MESWQITHITKNLPDLLSLTICNAKLLATLGAAELLADSDVKTIKAERNQHDKATLMYDILKTRTNGYHGLIRALIATKQSGAAKILLQLSPNKIGSLKISLQDAVHLVNELLTEEEIQAISAWIKNNLSMDECLKIHEGIQAAETGSLELVRDTIPKPHALYIPRLLSRRLGVNPDVFEKSCLDVFVFKECEKSQLQAFVKSYTIASSSEQLLQRNITSRFLLLDCDNDWTRICDSVKSPVHLIKYDKFAERFLLEATTGGSNALRPYLRHHGESGSQYVSEDAFVEIACRDTGRGFCICDSPGMGKSLLLASIARKASGRWPERIVGFIQLQHLVLQENWTVDDIALKTLEFISTSLLSSQILYKLYKRNEVRLELFFDGLDEVQHENLDSTTTFLKQICKDMPTAKVYVTSRPVVRAELEKAMGMIAYDMQPFNRETQVSYLTKHWAKTEPKASMNKLAEYAEYCIRGLQQTFKDNDRKIAGVPLMCWLLAEVYMRKATTYADTSRKKPIKLPENFVSSLYEIYKKYISRQLGDTICKFACMYKYDLAKPLCDTACLIYSYHVWQALLQVIPMYSFELGKFVSRFENLRPCQILAPGVLDEGQQNQTYVFMHRTFAEYLVAEFFAKNFLWELDVIRTTSQLSPQIIYLGLNEILRTTIKKNKYKFDFHSVFWENIVAYFLDAMILQNCEKVTLYSARISPFKERFFYWVEGCLHGNYHGLLNLLLEFATKFTSNPAWTLRVYNKLLCLWKSYNEPIASVLYVASVYCNKETIENLFQCFQKLFNLDLAKALQHEKSISDAVGHAITCSDYELVQYLAEKFPFVLENGAFLSWFENCVVFGFNIKEDTYFKILDLIRTHNSSQRDLYFF